MDPTPFDRVVFVGVVLKDTAPLVVVPEVGPETGLRNRAHVSNPRSWLVSFPDPRSNPVFRMEKTFWAWCWVLL